MKHIGKSCIFWIKDRWMIDGFLQGDSGGLGKGGQGEGGGEGGVQGSYGYVVHMELGGVGGQALMMTSSSSLPPSSSSPSC